MSQFVMLETISIDQQIIALGEDNGRTNLTKSSVMCVLLYQ